jgi:hypothetical protein
MAVSDYLWLRKYRILITDKDDRNALDVSDLHCTFEVHKRRSQGASYAIVRIYNLANDTEQLIINDGDRVIIEAGYEGTMGADRKNDLLHGPGIVSSKDTGEEATSSGQYGVIFDGQVVYPTRSKETNTDYVLTLSCIDGNQPLNFNYIQKSINKGMNQRQIYDEVCKSGSVPMTQAHVTDGLSGQALPRGKVFFGRTMDYVEDICRGNNALYFMDGGQVNLYRLTDVADDEALVVDPYTGLIGVPQQTTNGLNFRLLLNPSVKLMTKIKIARSEIKEQTLVVGQKQLPLDDEWIYQAIEVTHRGDTRGNDWYTDVVGISRYGAAALPGILANGGTYANGT